MTRPFTADAASILAQTAHLSTREFGSLMRLALHYWQFETLPTTPAGRAEVCRCAPREVGAMLPRLLPFFEPGATFPILKSASNAKTARRSKAGSKGGAAREKSRSKLSQVKP